MSRSRVAVLSLLTFFLIPLASSAGPGEVEVAGGEATVVRPDAQTTEVLQASDRAILNWRSFSIGPDELVKFVQPGASSVALNRVTGAEPSSILGRLASNGRVFLLNPNGILFGPGATVDVAGLIASTLSMEDSEFLEGRYTLCQDPEKALGAVVNEGEIRVSESGFVFLVAPAASNGGLIVANLGTVVLGSGEKLVVDFMGDGLINFEVSGRVLESVTTPDGRTLGSAVANSGTIRADGGTVVLHADAAGSIFASAVNHSGVIEARSLVDYQGEVRLEASDPVANTGRIGAENNLGRVHGAEGAVLDTGEIDVSAIEAGASAGEVTVTGEFVGVSGAIHARGAGGGPGGDVLLSSTTRTFVGGDAEIDVSGQESGDAGNVVVWSDDLTQFYGTILGRGGDLLGDGGNAEVSGYGNLAFGGFVDLSAEAGTAGTVLLDPTTFNLGDFAGAGTLDGQLPIITAGGANAGGNTVDAIVGASNVQSLLNAGTAVQIEASQSGSVTGTPTITWNTEAPLTLRTTNTAAAGTLNLTGLTLTAGDLVEVAPSITIQGSTSGLNACDVTSGVIQNFRGGTVTVTSGNGSVIVNGDIRTDGGIIALSSTTGISKTAGLLFADAVVTTGSGSVTLLNNIVSRYAANITGGASINFNGSSGFLGGTRTSTVNGVSGVTTAGGTIRLAAGTTLEITAGNNVSTGGIASTITYASDSMILTGSTNAGAAGTVILDTATSSRTVNLGGGLNLSLDAAELATITAGTLRIGDANNTGAFTITANIASPAPTLVLQTQGAISESNGAALTATSLSLTGGASIALNTATNAIAGNLAATTNGALSIVNGAALTVGAVDGLNGVTASGGTLTLQALTGRLTVNAGSSVSNGGTANVINMVADDMRFDGTVNATANGTVILDAAGVLTPINLNGPGGLSLDNALLSTITAGTLQIGTLISTLSITIQGPTVSPAPTLLLFTQNGGPGTIAEVGTGSITATNLSLFAGGGVSANSVNNNVTGTFAGFTNTGSFSFVDGTGFTVGTDGFLNGVSTGDAGISLTAGAGQSIALNGNPIAAGGATSSVTLSSPILLTTTTETISAGSGGVSFASTIDGAQRLVVNDATGTVSFGGAVGGTTSLASLSVSGGTIALNSGGGVSTSGAAGQVFTGNVTLGASQTLTAAGGGPVTFTGTIGNAVPRSLTISDAAGVVTFGGAIGGGTPLSSLDVTGATIALNGPTVSTNGAGGQSYTGAVTLGADETLTATGGGPISFSSTITNGVARALTVNDTGGTISFGGAVGTGANPLASLALTSGTVTLNTTTLQGNLVASTTGSLNQTPGTTLTAAGVSATGTGDVNLFETTNAVSSVAANLAGNGALSLVSTQNLATATVNGVIGVTTAAGQVSLTVRGGNRLTVSEGNGIVTGGNRSITLFADQMTLLGGENAGGGIVNLAPFSDNVTIHLNGAGGLSLDNAALATVTAGTLLIGGVSFRTQNIVIDGNTVAGSPRLDLVSQGSVTEGAGAGLTATNLRLFGRTAVTLGSATNAVSGTVAGSSNGDFAFTDGVPFTVGVVDESGITSTAGNVTLATVGGATLTIAGVNIAGQAATSSVTLNAPIQLTAGAVQVNSGSGGLLFSGSIDGGQTLTVNDATGTVDFRGAVGSATPLTSLTVTSATYDLRGAITNGTSVRTVGGQTWNGAGVLFSSQVLQTGNGGTVRFQGPGTIDGAFGLTVNDTGGTVSFEGVVGGTTALASLTINGGAGATINLDAAAATTVTATGNVTFDGNVRLGAAQTIVSTGGLGSTVDFARTIDGAFTLTVTDVGGSIRLGGTVGGTTALSGLAVTAGTIALDAAGGATTTGGQSFEGATVLGASPTLASTAGGALLFQGPGTIDAGVAGTQGVTFSTTGNLTVNGAIGGTRPVASLTVNNANDATFAAAVTATGSVVQVGGTGTTTLNGATIGGNLSVTTSAIALNTATASATGGATLNARNSVTINVRLDGGGSALSLAANQDGGGVEGILMNAGASLATTNAGANALDMVVNTGAGGNGSASIRAITATGTVAIQANGGSIVDATAGAANDITATSASLRGGAGVGAAAFPLLTAVQTFAASGGAGGVFLTNTGALTIGAVGGLAGASATTGAIEIHTRSPLLVNADVVTLGAILLSADRVGARGVVPVDNLTVGTNVRVESTGSTVTLHADDDLTTEAGSFVCSAVGFPVLTAGEGDGDLGVITINGFVCAEGQAGPPGQEAVLSIRDLLLRMPYGASAFDWLIDSVQQLTLTQPQPDPCER